MDVDALFCAVDRIKDSPFSHGILGEPREVVRNRFMPQIVDIGRQPFGLVEQPLGHGLVNRGEILSNAGFKGESVPGHRILPPKAEPLRHVFAGEALTARE